MSVWLVVGIVLVLAVLGAIYALARQGTKQTGDLAYRVEQWLVRVVPPSGVGGMGEPTWAGLTIRRLAHVAEFAALGLAMGVLCAAALGRGDAVSWMVSCVLCAVASVADELHKRFVPGRHFDGRDLLLDAVGYVPSALLVALVC